MERYEYIDLKIDLGDLEQLNRYADDGWRISQVVWESPNLLVAILERKLPDAEAN